MIRHGNRPFAILCRSDLFRTQVFRFRLCQYRRPTRAEMRALWRSTGFQVLAD